MLGEGSDSSVLDRGQPRALVLEPMESHELEHVLEHDALVGTEELFLMVDWLGLGAIGPLLSRALPRLRRLFLMCSDHEPGVFRELEGAPWLPGLTTLELACGRPIADEGCLAIFTRGQLEYASWTQLTRMGDDDADHLEHLLVGGVRSLRCPLVDGNAALWGILERVRTPLALETLEVQVDGAELPDLSAYPSLHNLKSLTLLSQSVLPVAKLESIRRLEALPSLVHLQIV